MFRTAVFILEETVYKYGLTPEILRSSTRTATVSHCRAEVARRLKLETHLSGSEIASLIGRKSAVRTRDYFKGGRLSTP
jgi:hypothetical protein